MIDLRLKAWDICATKIIAEEAGEKYVLLREIEGSDNIKRSDVIFGKPKIVDAVIDLLDLPGSLRS